MKIEQPPPTDRRHDTPGGPITGRTVVPWPWQEISLGGPINVAGDSDVTRLRQHLRTGEGVYIW